MSATRPSILMCVTGFAIGGGISSVNRSMLRAFADEQRGNRIDRIDCVTLCDSPDSAQKLLRSEQRFAERNNPRFAWHAWRLYRRRRHDWVIFDHLGVSRAMMLPLPGLPPSRFAIFHHGFEFGSSRLHKRAFAEASLIWANSSFTARKLRDVVQERLERIVHLPLCIEPERAESWSDTNYLHRSAREPAVLIAARMVAEERGKGHDTLIEAWPGIVERHPRARLWIAGDGDDRSRLEQEVARRGLGASVRFLGMLDRHALSDRFDRASVFAMPSRQEGFGLVYAEAMWHGLPCVVSTADAGQQLVRDGETGRHVPYGDAGRLAQVLVELLDDPERCRRMGSAGREFVERHHTFDRFRRNLLQSMGLTPRPDNSDQALGLDLT